MKHFSGTTENPMINHLIHSIETAQSIRLIVSFLMESGVKLITPALKHAVARGATVEIVTGTYMKVTQPNALYRLIDMINMKQIRIYPDQSISFHPKTYIFDYPEQSAEIIIGSSNLSYSALKTGVEWNCLFTEREDPKTYTAMVDAFQQIYRSATPLTLSYLRDYQLQYQQNLLADPPMKPEEIKQLKEPEPLNMQIPALYELKRTRLDGYQKALVVAATGLGKTYLTAFDTAPFNRVLFIAHREEILTQAQETFKKVSPGKSAGFFMNETKDTASDIIFATIQTIGKDCYLSPEYFKPDHFDYIVVDEFHHAAAKSYRKIIDYFTPRFLLGITATPDRTDGGDIYALCDYNVAYRCNINTAINHGWLVPFTYFGIYDGIDYSEIPWRSGRYDPAALENSLMVQERCDEIMKQYRNHHGSKTIAFCAGIKHAEFIAAHFKKSGIKAKALHSGVQNRKELMEQFESGELSVLCVVDIFNEGIDIPAIDTVLFLRPTESFTIFMQQLGRGLRLCEGKDRLTVLDFVGNYKKSELKLNYLTGSYNPAEPQQPVYEVENLPLPAGCQLFFDFKLIDLFKELQKQKQPLKIKLINAFNELSEQLNRRPTMVEVDQLGQYPVRLYRSTFKSWLRFLNHINQLTSVEKTWLDSVAGELLLYLEKTSMSKSYKMAVFAALIHNNKLQQSITIDHLLPRFKNFYHQKPLYQKDLQQKSNQNISDQRLKQLIIKMPLHFLSKNKLFTYINNQFSLPPSLKITPEFTEAFIERINYRIDDYFRRRF